MMLLMRDGSVVLSEAGDCGQTKGTIDLPADLVTQQSDLIDRVFAFAFDVLGLQTVELRVRPADIRAGVWPLSSSLVGRERR
jgi:hypothetical protein